MNFEQTHPWITFSLTLDASDLRLWLKLGEVASKCEHLSGVPLRPEVAKRMNQVFLAKGVLATTAIEGNTLSEEQVMDQVQGKLNLPPSQKYLQQEIENIIELCNYEIEFQLDSDREHPASNQLCSKLVKFYNMGILKNLDVDDDVVPGELRTHSVIVGNVYRGAPAEDCELLLDRLCTWLCGEDFSPPEEDLKIPFAAVRAIVAHVYLAWIHPFGDGNGRTARMMEFHILIASGFPVPAAHLLSDHYNRTRTQYYRELDRASKSGGDLMPFIRYAVQGLLDGLRDQIAQVREHQMDVAWENYVHRMFRDKKPTPTQKRRRDLVLELSARGWLPVAEIPELSPKMAAAYAGAGEKMVQRDLNGMKKMGLVDREFGRVRARKYLIEAFLPARVQDDLSEQAT